MKKPRNLTNEELMIKVDNCTETEVTLVLYTKPATIMELMDETYGAENWQAEHTIVSKGNGQVAMLCKISVYDDKHNRWIARSDAGEPVGLGNHADKSQATDALKRACALFGVAKELKTLPEAIICRTFEPALDEAGNPVKLNGFPTTKTLINVTHTQNGSWECRDTFSIVQYLLDDKGNICALCIRDDSTGERVFCVDYRNNRNPPVRSDIMPLTSAELARYSLLVADVGSFARSNITLGKMKPDELRWLFGATSSLDIKRGCLELAKAFPEIKDCFLQGDINPDALLKQFR